MYCGAALGADIPARPSIPEARVSEIPIKFYQQYFIVVEGRIGSLDHQHLLLDTGTNPSMIDSKVCAKLGLLSTVRSLSLFNKNVASSSAKPCPSLNFDRLLPAPKAA